MSMFSPENSGSSSGSYGPQDADRPRWDQGTVLVDEYVYRRPDGSYAFSQLKGERTDGHKVFLKGQEFGGSRDDLAIERQNWPQEFYNLPGLSRFRKGGGDEPNLLYRIDELTRQMALRPSERIFITEGEKDADTLWALGLMATTNPNGALNWRAEHNHIFAERNVAVLVDNDERGRERGPLIQSALSGIAQSTRIVELPDLVDHGDVTDWLNGGRSKDDLLKVVEEAERGAQASGGAGVALEDFRAFMPAHNYIFAPSGEAWPATSVNSRIRPVELHRDGAPVLDDNGEQVKLAANKWLDEHRPVEQMTWAPGHPQIIIDRLISEGGWIHRPGCNVFNLYRPPSPPRGDPEQAQPWLDHIRRGLSRRS